MSIRVWYTTLALAVGLALFLAPRQSQAIQVTVEPDDFPRFTDLTNAVPGVTLSVAKTTGEPTSTDINKVVVLGDPTTPPVISSTGSLVFGRQVGAFFPDQNWFQSGLDFVPAVFRADFATPTDFVSIDIIRTSELTDTGQLRAFDASGNLLDTFTATLGAVGTFVTASVSEPTADIAYILAAGFPSGDPPFHVVGVDHLQFNVIAVPEPGTLALLVVAVMGVVLARMRFT